MVGESRWIRFLSHLVFELAPLRVRPLVGRKPFAGEGVAPAFSGWPSGSDL